MTSKQQTGWNGLRALREARDLTQEALARELDVPTGAIVRLEQGRTKFPRTDLFDRLLAFFNCTPNDLMLAPAKAEPSPAFEEDGSLL